MRAPVLAAGDGALGFWAALRDVFPETKEQRCWFHKIANVLNCLPKSAQPGAKAALAEIWQAEDKDHALAAVKAFEAAYWAKWPNRQQRRSPTTLTCSSRSTTTRPSIGSICGPRTRSFDLRDRPPASTRHQRPRIQGRRDSDGLHAHRVSTGSLARRHCTPSRATRASRSHLQERQTRRTKRPDRPRGGSRLKEPHPQVLTITQLPTRRDSWKVPVKCSLLSVRVVRNRHLEWLAVKRVYAISYTMDLWRNQVSDR